MLIAVASDGCIAGSHFFIEVDEKDEKTARIRAYLHVYEGHSNIARAESLPSELTLDAYARIAPIIVI